MKQGIARNASQMEMNITMVRSLTNLAPVNLGEIRTAQTATLMVIKISMANHLPTLLLGMVTETETQTAPIVIAQVVPIVIRTAQTVILLVMKINMENPN